MGLSVSSRASVKACAAVTGERWLQLQAAVLLPVVALWLRRRGLGSCLRIAQRRLDQLDRPDLDSTRQRDYALRVTELVARANERYSLLQADCLPLAIVSWYLARWVGSQVDFRLGVRTLTGRFEAHAWIELADEPLGEVEDVTRIYTSMDVDRLLRPLRRS